MRGQRQAPDPVHPVTGCVRPAGTTAVVALVDGDQVVVASCGDSRAVLCDARGNAVPLTTDHKPDQVRPLTS